MSVLSSLTSQWDSSYPPSPRVSYSEQETRPLGTLPWLTLSCELLWGQLHAALIRSSAGILLYGWAIFQKRLTLISTRNPDGFGELPLVPRL